MSFTVVIPARYASSRLPGKPLAMILAPTRELAPWTTGGVVSTLSTIQNVAPGLERGSRIFWGVLGKGSAAEH